MKAIVAQKISSLETDYGEKIGGKTGTATPTNIETNYLENVTSVIETTVDGVSVYQVTHKTGADASQHTTNYPISNYNISVIGG